MSVPTMMAVMVLAAPACWLAIGGAIHRPRPDGRQAPPLLRALGYDLIAIALGAACGWHVVAPEPGVVQLGPVVATAGAAAIGVALHVLYAGRSPRLLVRGVRSDPRRFGVQAAVTTATSIAEEIAWRGVALGTAVWWWGWPIWVALPVTGLLFGLLHLGLGGPKLVATHTVTGLVLGGIYLATGNLAVPLAAHVAYNLAVVSAHQLRPDSAQADRIGLTTT